MSDRLSQADQSGLTSAHLLLHRTRNTHTGGYTQLGQKQIPLLPHSAPPIAPPSAPPYLLSPVYHLITPLPCPAQLPLCPALPNYHPTDSLPPYYFIISYFLNAPFDTLLSYSFAPLLHYSPTLLFFFHCTPSQLPTCHSATLLPFHNPTAQNSCLLLPLYFPTTPPFNPTLLTLKTPNAPLQPNHPIVALPPPYLPSTFLLPSPSCPTLQPHSTTPYSHPNSPLPSSFPIPTTPSHVPPPLSSVCKYTPVWPLCILLQLGHGCTQSESLGRLQYA